MISGHKLNKIKRDSRKDSIIAHIIFSMGKFNLDYSALSRLTGFTRGSIKYGIQHPDNISVDRLNAILTAIFDYIEMVKSYDYGRIE